MTLDKFLRWTAYSALFAVLITPFIVTESLFFPFITGKNFFFRVMVEIAAASWIVLAFRDVSFRPKKSQLLWALAAFVALIGISNVFGENPWKSFWSNFERMEGYVTMLHLFVYFIVMSSMLGAERLWKRFFEISVWASALVSSYGLIQLLTKDNVSRLDSTLGNATYLAIYVLFNIFFALIIMAKDRTFWKRWVYGAISVMNLIVMYNTGTRGSVIGLIAGAIAVALLIAVFDREEKKKRAVAASILGGVVLLVAGFVAARDSSFVRESPILSRFASISVEELRTQGRYFIWPMAIEGFKERPLLGWGQENFNYVFNEHYDPRMYGQEQWFDRAHNAALDWLIAGGIAGLVAYLSIFGAAIYLLWRRTPDMSFTEKSLITGLGTAYFVNNMFVFDNIVSYIMFFSLIAYIQFRSTTGAERIPSSAGNASADTAKVIGASAFIALAFCLYFFNWRGYATASSLLDALRLANTPTASASEVAAAFKEALSYDTLGRSEVLERYIETVPRINRADTPMSVNQEYFDIGREAVEKQLARAPGDARYELFAGTFYSLYGIPGPAREHLYNAAELSPRKQSILYALGNFYLTNGQTGDAVVTLKQAYDLEPSNDTAATYYAAALIAAGQEQEARAFMIERFGTADMTSDVFLQSYAAGGNWQQVISILRQRIAADPRNLALRQNLAAAYLEAGNRTAAVTVLREMAEIDPSFASTAEAYILQIQSN